MAQSGRSFLVRHGHVLFHTRAIEQCFHKDTKITPIIKHIPLVLLFICVPLTAENTEDKKKELEKVSKEIQENIEKQYKLYEEEKSILYQIEKFDQRLEDLSKRTTGIKKKLSQYENDISYSKKQLSGETEKLKKVENDLNERMRQLYKEGSFKNLKVLMSAVSFEDFMKKYEVLVAIAKKDLELKEKILKKKKDLSSKKTDFERRFSRYESYKKSNDEKSKELIEQKDKKSGLLTGIKDQKALYDQVISELKQQSDKIESMIRQYDKQAGKIEVPPAEGDINKLKGRLPQPAAGKVVSFFGKYKHPKFNVYVFNNGIEIASNGTEPVKPVFPGVVIFADWFKGYGKTVLIDHGNNVVGIYGHLSEISVNFGQKVGTVDLLGKAGSTGSSENISVYFEIRKDGKPENPLEWLAKKD